MLEIDLRNAFYGSSDNFTCLLLRLIAKADGSNRQKLMTVFPAEVTAVYIYQNACPYKDVACTQVDWKEIARRAEEKVREEYD